MNKKIMTLLLAGLMLLMAIPVSANLAYLDVSVSASATDIGVGDIVEYIVTASGEDVLAVQFELVIPEGLCYVSNSAATPQGLAQKLGVAAADWTEDTMMFTYYNDVGIHMKAGTELLRFTCRAEKEGEYAITIHKLLPYDSAFEGFAPSVYVQPVKVSGSAGAEQDPDIPGRICQDIRRSIDQMQQRINQKIGQNCHEQCQTKTDPASVPEILLESFRVFGTDGFCQRNGKTGAGAAHKADHQEVQRRHTAHRCKRFAADEPSHHDGIHEGVHLLKQRTHYQREREQQNLFDGFSGC
jgi:uncharacterized repeat protein (TIGR01451 family)